MAVGVQQFQLLAALGVLSLLWYEPGFVDFDLIGVLIAGGTDLVVKLSFQHEL